jgi:hypothetical protein
VARCTGNKFGPVPGFYEQKAYLAEESSQHACQTNNADLIAASQCLTENTDCEFEAGCYGLRLANSFDATAPGGYRDNSAPNACLNTLTGTTNFHQRTTNGWVHIFVSGTSDFALLNDAMQQLNQAEPQLLVGIIEYSCCDIMAYCKMEPARGPQTIFLGPPWKAKLKWRREFVGLGLGIYTDNQQS